VIPALHILVARIARMAVAEEANKIDLDLD